MLEREILNNLDCFIIVKDKDGKIVYYNKDLALKLSLQVKKDNELEYNGKHYKASTVKLDSNLTIETYTDITKYKENIEYYSNKLKKDQLTNLYNRHGLNNAFKNMLENNIPFSIILCDIDYFKKINDEYGHIEGDNALKYISEILRSSTRKTDYIIRYGGEEFLIILPYCNKEVAEEIANNIKQKLNNNLFTLSNNSKSIKITMTFGVTEFNENKNITSLIKEADDALYQGKTSGRNKVKVYSNKN